jgi:hypothetical protein
MGGDAGAVRKLKEQGFVGGKVCFNLGNGHGDQVFWLSSAV